MLHEVISASVAVFMDAAIFTILLIAGARGRLWWEPGWSFVHAGIGLMFVGDLVELIDILLIANPMADFTYIVVDIAFLAGYLSMIYGGSRWLPIVVDRRRMERELELSESKYRAVVDNVKDGILIINDQYQVLLVNPMISELSGYQEEELVGKDFRQFIHPDSLQPVLERYSQLKKGEDIRIPREIKFLRKDGEVRDVDVSTSILNPQEGQARILGRITDITERKRIEDQLRNLSAHLQSAREETQKILSQEIHDELGQELTALQMDLSWIKKRMPEDYADLHMKAESMTQLLHSTIQTVKRLSSKLRPPVLDLGVVAALEWEAEEFQEHTGITCQLVVTPGDIKLKPDLSTVIYRIFQETLTNVARHSQADKVDAKLELAGGKIVLEIKDNGIGISDEKISGSRSIGIIGTRERVSQFGGDIHYDGQSGKGTTVTVTIPWNE